VKFLRLLLTCVALSIALVAVLVLAAIAPAVQTFVAQRALAARPGLSGSLESLSAGFGGVDIEDLHLEIAGAVLRLPSLQARLPITAAVLRRKVSVRSLVAKGWTLDLSRTREAPGAPASSAAARTAFAREVAGIFHGILGGWKLPFDGSLDGVELEGDVLLAAAPGRNPVKVHLVITGGGMSAGHEGAFAVEATGTVPGSAVNAAHCRLVVAMESPRTVDRVGITAGFSGGSGSRQEDLALSAEIAAARGPGEEHLGLVLSRGGRHLATLIGRFSAATRRLAGTWKVDLRSTDLAPFAPLGPLPPFLATGEGQFDADAAFTLVHAAGSLETALSGLGAIAPPLERLGTVRLATRFDLTHSGESIRVDSLNVSIAGARPVGVVRSLQAFVFDERTGELSVADTRGDWFEASIRALPLEWLPDLAEGISLSGGDAAGDFVVRAAGGEIALRQKTPLAAAGASIQSAGRPLARGLDLSLSMAADCGPRGWQVQAAPLEIFSAGRRLATIEARASCPAGGDQPVAVAGKWSADIEAVEFRRAFPALGWITGRLASGDFSASVGTSKKVEATMVVAGHNPGNSVAASVHADVDPYGAVAFVAPVKIAFGSSASDVSAEGTWIREAQGSWVKASVTGGSVTLEHLRLLVAPLAALGGAPFPASGIPTDRPPAVPGARDKVPFWGDWTGHVTVAFDRVKTDDNEFSHVGGAFDVDRGSIHMRSGRGGLNRHLLTNVEGSISFDAAAEFPYSVKAAAAVNEIDAAPLFPPSQPGNDPLFEGHFSVQSTLDGKGINLTDLLGRTQAGFRLTTKAGIVRLLRANVAESLPEAPSTVSDALGTVGYVVGSVFGLKKESVGSAKSPLSKTADAVLNFTYQVSEIGCDEITVNAIRGSDGTIHLADIEMTAPDEHLKGSGQITYVKGAPLFKRPLSLELELGARGKVAELLSTAGLLSSKKDGLGYAILSEPIRFGGTLEHIDESQWNGLLVKAATRKPDAEKKPAAGPAPKSS
jgi:hypothetical protein